MKPFHQFKAFQFRFEKLGRPECHYLHRWTLILFGYSIRLHHWIASDASIQHFHDHPFDFISIILKGSYTNVTPEGRIEVKAPSIWKAKAEGKHYLLIPRGGAWTILLCSRPHRKWGFWVNNHLWRPLRYFHKFGHPPCGDCQ